MNGFLPTERALPSEVSLADVADALTRIASTSETCVVGLVVLARASSGTLAADVAEDLVEELRGVVSTTRFVGSALGVLPEDPPRRPTCERLRWEWLASTGALLDGDPRHRLAAECGVALERARVAAERLVVALDAAGVPAFVHAGAQLERRLSSAGLRLVGAVRGEAPAATI